MAQLFNACEYLLDRRLAAGDGQRIALTGPAGELTYAELHDRVCRTAAGLRAVGVQPEQRVLMVMSDSPDFVVVYLAAMRVGAIPVPVSTMLRADGIAELLGIPGAVPRGHPRVRRRGGVGRRGGARTGRGTGGRPLPASTRPVHLLSELAAAAPDDVVYDTSADSPAFWLYTSGTTGTPKGAMHRHGSVQVVCETYGTQVLGIRPGRPLPVGGQGVLRLRPRQLGAVPDVGRRGGGAEPGAVATRRDRRGRRQVRRDLVLRRPDVLRQHAARRAASRTPSRASGWRPRRGRRCPRRSTSAGRRASASTSSTASG